MASFTLLALLLAVSNVVLADALTSSATFSRWNGKKPQAVTLHKAWLADNKHGEMHGDTVASFEAHGIVDMMKKPMDLVSSPLKHLMKYGDGEHPHDRWRSMTPHPSAFHDPMGATQSPMGPTSGESSAMKRQEDASGTANLKTDASGTAEAPRKPHEAILNHARPHDRPLPPWAMVACGLLVCIVISFTFSSIKTYIFNVVPGGCDSQRLEIVLAEAMDRVEVLKAELEARYANEAAPLVDVNEDPEVTAARERAQELKEKTEAQAAEIRSTAERIAEQRDSIIAGSVRVQEVFKQNIEVGRENLEDFGKKEANAFYNKMQKSVEDSDIPAWEAPDWMAASETDDCISLPPLLNLIQGTFATAQIHGLKDGSNSAMLLDLVIMSVSGVVFYFDWEKPCKDVTDPGKVWIWHIGLLSSAALDFVLRFFVARWAGDALEDLRLSREKQDKENADLAGGSLFDTFTFIRRGGASFFEPYFKYRNIADGWTVKLTSWFPFFNLVWGGFGLYISIHDVVLDSLGCQAHIALKYLHVYSFLWLMFSTWLLLYFSITLAGSLASCSPLTDPLVGLAKWFDDDTMGGVPIALTLVQSFVLKNSSTKIGMNTREVEDDLRALNAKLKEAQFKLEDKSKAFERVNEAALNMPTTQIECLDQYQQLTNDSLEQVKPIVGFLAAQVPTNEPADPQAGSSMETSSFEAQDRRVSIRRQSLNRAAPKVKNMQTAGAGSTAESDVESY